MKNIILYILMIAFASPVLGQDNSNLIFTKYGIEDGMPSLSMKILGQDSTGYIWLTDPLTRFDGKHFETYQIDQHDESLGYISEVTSMADDGHGNLVFACWNGVYYFDNDKQYVVLLPSISQNSELRKIFYEKPNTFWDLGKDHLMKIEFPSLDTSVFHLKDHEFAPDIIAQNNKDVLWINVKGKNKVRRIELNSLRHIN